MVLAIGRRGTPRRLGVPGEELAKVAYGLTDPEQYDGAKVLVVGGGDAALEAAIQLAEQSAAEVTLSYRGAELARCRDANRASASRRSLRPGRVTRSCPSQVREIRPREVALDAGGRGAASRTTSSIVNVGGELPLELLAKAGVSLRRFHGEAPGEGDDAKAARRRAAEERHRAERLAPPRLSASCTRWPARRSSRSSPGRGGSYYPLAARRAAPLRRSTRASSRPAPGGTASGSPRRRSCSRTSSTPLRKRWRRLGALGNIRGWLDFHVFVGFMSPLVIAFHAAFQSNNLLASGTAGALAIVVTTGIIGRFIYGAVPSDGGKAVELADLLARFERLRDDLGPLLAARRGPGARPRGPRHRAGGGHLVRAPLPADPARGARRAAPARRAPRAIRGPPSLPRAQGGGHPPRAVALAESGSTAR